MSRKNVSLLSFALACNEANSAQEVADKLSMKVSRVVNRARSAQKAGVNIKTFDVPRVSRKLSVADINSQLAAFGNGHTD